jgi:hypothetical protein
MLLFGHIGITLASAVVGFGLREKFSHHIEEDNGGELSPSKDSQFSDYQSSKPSLFMSLAKHVDIRFLLVGSVLPDIIDKPIGIFLFRATFSSGRIYAHTLLFLVLVTIIGLLIKRYSGKTWSLALSLGTLLHLMLDQMWQMLKTLLWPLFGTDFEKIETTYWLDNYFYALFEEPSAYVPEMIGFVALIWFSLELLHRKAVAKFFKQGSVS